MLALPCLLATTGLGLVQQRLGLTSPACESHATADIGYIRVSPWQSVVCLDPGLLSVIKRVIFGKTHSARKTAGLYSSSPLKHIKPPKRIQTDYFKASVRFSNPITCFIQLTSDGSRLCENNEPINMLT